MILYFSGTGNSEYVAKNIRTKTKDDTINLLDRIKQHDYTELHSDRPWVIIAPTYAWRIPRILHEWLEKTEFIGSRDIYFIMTCGGNIGNSGKYLQQLCDSKQLNYRGCYPIIMPENYIALFSTPSKEEALNTVRQAEGEIEKAGSLIADQKTFPQPSLTTKDKLNSGIVNDVFYPLFVHAKKFYAKDTCICCKQCAKVCPTNNIRMENKKPVWGKDCTHCMACICRCPVEAIEYGKHSEGMPRYTCPL